MEKLCLYCIYMQFFYFLKKEDDFNAYGKYATVKEIMKYFQGIFSTIKYPLHLSLESVHFFIRHKQQLY